MQSSFSRVLAVLLFFAPGLAYATEPTGIASEHPSVSSSGDVVFSSDATGTQNLWVASGGGTAIRQLTTGGDGDDEPVWSPDGSRVVFTRRTADVTNIWTVNYNGTQLTQLTDKSLNNRNPTWSPDGQKIAFVSDRAGTNDLWIMVGDGTSQTRVTTSPAQENNPSFSPTGGQLVFSSTSNNKAALMIVNIDGTGLRSLTNGQFSDWHPSWAAKGILFSSNRSSTNWKIWIIQSDGTGLRQVSKGLGLDPAWTPSGDIVFTDEFSQTAALTAPSLLNFTTGLKSSLIPPAFSGDLNGDGIIDLKDIALVQAAINTNTSVGYDPRDRNNDGRLDALDLRILTNLCTYARCASTPN